MTKKLISILLEDDYFVIFEQAKNNFDVRSNSDTLRKLLSFYKKNLIQNVDISTITDCSPNILENNYPQSVEEVMQIAYDNCIMITQDIAEAYFLNRDSADWHNANGNKIRVAGIVSDIKQWVLRTQAMKAHNQRYYGDEPQRTGNYNANQRQQAIDNGIYYGDNDLSQSSKSMLD